MKIERKIAGCDDAVFLPKDFRSIGGEDQVLRVLRGLVLEGILVRLGYGVYCRATVLSSSDQSRHSGIEGFAEAVGQALTKLGVEWDAVSPDLREEASQGPSGMLNIPVRTKRRFMRQLRYETMELSNQR
jgi:hypothetical protein